MKDILSLKLYTRVARLGSFSAAARECGLSQSQVSRIIAELESDLGARLLTRTTRAVMLTDAGAEFLSRLDPILIALEDAEQSVREGSELRGMLRMSMPGSVAIREIIPRLAPFLERHPELRLQMLLGDRPRDFVKEAVDVAIRLGRLIDSSATAMLITQIPRVIIASPGYVDRHGVPTGPEDLVRHRIVDGPASVVSSGWQFARASGEEVAVDLEPHFSTNENEGAVAAAVAGIGITSTSEWACRRELADGSLVRLLVDWKMADIPVHAYFPMGRATRAAGRAVVEHLTADFRREQHG
ncbi:LysR family transcriptional regulator [Paraburkholderia phenazinium]|uniref:DNA-binding transcriptional regulator, LysR family n=1 Tax=Paraburkholderia phenazinium TaxID=60549 RepID=A0A1G7TXX6_9BURK|nr:LysR family transcriptional regulator [Paraburkholderia phenazinium]SDG39874.1 DNA-binding transcriptional regulator, LysR family [Paraburkholderia phenazinium]